jgi:hypothetical protein
MLEKVDEITKKWLLKKYIIFIKMSERYFFLPKLTSKEVNIY